MQKSGGWLQGIQYFRAIAILSVVIFHIAGIGSYDVPNPLWSIVALTAFASCGVPLFIFVSGVVLYNRYANDFSLSIFYKKRFSAVVPPYVIWSTIYFALFFVGPVISPFHIHQPTVQGSNPSVATLASTYLAQLAVGYQHLWFIPALIGLYALYPLLERMYTRTARQNSPIYVLSILLLIQIGYSALVVVFPQQIVSLLLVLSYVFYFVFGFFIAQHYDTMKQRVATYSLKGLLLGVIAATMYYAVVYYRGVIVSPALPLYVWLNVVTRPFYCLLLILFFLRISTTQGEPHGFFLSYLEKIGEDSFGIFLIHWFFLFVFRITLFRLGLSEHNLLLYPMLFVLTIVSSYVAVEVIYRLPYSNIIIGKPRKKQARIA